MGNHPDRLALGTAWGGDGAAWAAAIPRTGNKAGKVFHETRPFPFTNCQTFLLERTRPPTMVFTNHESRITNHGLSESRPFLLEIPAMWTKSRFPQENTRSAAFAAAPVALRAGPAAADANGHATPASAANSPLIRVDSCPFVVNEPMMRRMKGERSISRQNARI